MGPDPHDLDRLAEQALRLRRLLDDGAPIELVEMIMSRVYDIMDELSLATYVTSQALPRHDARSEALAAAVGDEYFVTSRFALDDAAYAFLHAPYGRVGSRYLPRAGDEISVAAYIDGADESTTRDLIDCVDDLVEVLGYQGPIDAEYESGSVFRKSKAKANEQLSKKRLRDRLDKVEHALELRGLSLSQAEFDQRESEVVARLLAAIGDAPRACIRVGAVLVLKFPSGSGPPVVLARTLSAAEVRAFDHYPELQMKPETLLSALAMAVGDDPPERGAV